MDDSLCAKIYETYMLFGITFNDKMLKILQKAILNKTSGHSNFPDRKSGTSLHFRINWFSLSVSAFKKN